MATIDPTVSPMLLNPHEAAWALGISERTLHRITAPRGTLRTTPVAKRLIRYDPADLRKWIDEQKQSTS